MSAHHDQKPKAGKADASVVNAAGAVAVAENAPAVASAVNISKTATQANTASLASTNEAVGGSTQVAATPLASPVVNAPSTATNPSFASESPIMEQIHALQAALDAVEKNLANPAAPAVPAAPAPVNVAASNSTAVATAPVVVNCNTSPQPKAQVVTCNPTQAIVPGSPTIH